MTCDDVADLLDGDRADLDEGARARRAAHLEACADCRALAGAHAVAASALLAPAVEASAPSAIVRERLLGAAALLNKQLAEAHPAPGPAASDVRVRLRCTYCHGDLERGRAVYCADCLAPVHAGCFEDHGRCPAPGCGGQRLVEPRDARAARPHRRRSRTLLALLAGAALAGPVAAWSLLQPGPAVSEVSAPPGDLVVLPAAVTTAEIAAAVDAPAPVAAPPASLEPLRVLFVEDTPRWEYRYLKSALLRDPGVVVQCLLLSADYEYPQEHSSGAEPLRRLPDQAALGAYDVVVLGDVAMAAENTPYLYPGAFQAIGEAVRGGLGLLVIDGERSNRAWSDSPLGSILPVRFAAGPVGRLLTSGPFHPRRAPAGADVLRLDDDPAIDARVWDELPAFQAVVSVERVTADAEVLLSTRAPSGREHPVLATRRQGQGVVAWLGVDETWRWRAGVGDRHMGRFYRQLLRAIVDGSRAPAPVEGRVVRRDGHVLEVDVTAIEAQRAGWVVVTSDGQVTPLAAVERLGLSTAEGLNTRPALVLRDGSALRGLVASGGGEVVSFTCDALGEVSAPFDAVRALVLDTTPDGALDPARWRDHIMDRIVLRDASLPLEGSLTGVDAHEVRLETEFGRMAMRLERIGRVDWAALPPDPGALPPVDEPEGPRARVTFTDGTTLRATLRGLDGRFLQVRHPVVGERAVPRRHVAAIELD